MYFSKDLTQYVAYKKNTATALLDKTLSMFLVSVEADASTPDGIKKAISKFFSFANQTATPIDRSCDSNRLEGDLTQQHHHFYFDQAHKMFDLTPNEFWQHIYLHQDVYHYETLSLQTFIPNVYDSEHMHHFTPNLTPTQTLLSQHIEVKKREPILSQHHNVGAQLKLLFFQRLNYFV